MRTLERLKVMIKANGGSVDGITTISAAVGALESALSKPKYEQPHKNNYESKKDHNRITDED